MTTLFDVPIPTMSAFDSTRCYVREVSYRTAQLVLADTHYIGTPGATSVSLGIYADESIAGVLTFGTIPRNNAVSICGERWAPGVMELTRLALYGWMPTNSESWFIGRALAWLREHRPNVAILISYADDSVGHVGTIYQATNWTYTGTSTNDVVFVTEAGDVLHPRTTGRMRGELPPGAWRPSPAKHRYVCFLGSRTQRRSLRAALRWESMPYPKPERRLT